MMCIYNMCHLIGGLSYGKIKGLFYGFPGSGRHEPHAEAAQSLSGRGHQKNQHGWKICCHQDAFW